MPVGVILPLLAVSGAAALSYRLLRSLARAGLSSAELTAASGMAEVSARRGDLTSLAERREAEREARRQQRGDVLVCLGWLLCLMIPLFTAWTLPLFSAAAPLWLLPYRAVRTPRA